MYNKFDFVLFLLTLRAKYEWYQQDMLPNGEFKSKSSAIELEVRSNLFVILKTNPSILGARVWSSIVVRQLESHRKVRLSELVNACHLSERIVWDDC